MLQHSDYNLRMNKLDEKNFWTEFVIRNDCLKHTQTSNLREPIKACNSNLIKDIGLVPS